MRRKDREITEREQIVQILDKSRIVHLALFNEKYPYVLPMNFGYEFQGDTLILYVHGATEGHKWDLLRRDPHVAFALECDLVPVSGGDIPCKYGEKYASVMGCGIGELLAAGQEKNHALEVLMKHQTGREFSITAEMCENVSVMKLVAESYSAKRKA